MPKIAMASVAMVMVPWNEAIKVAAQSGFDAYEISTVFPSVDLDTVTDTQIEDARRIAEDAGMEICVHAPFVELNIAAFSRRVRELSVDYVKKSVDFCKNIGGTVLVVHSGTHSYTINHGATRHNDPGMKIQWEYNLESLRQINEYALSKGVIVCLENLGFKSVDRTIEDLLDIRNAVGDSLQFTLDIGHARLNVPGGVEKAIQVLGDNIRHIHFTDNNGEFDDHLPIGDGNFDYSGFLNFIKTFPYIVTLEVVHVGVEPEPIVRSLEYFRKLSL